MQVRIPNNFTLWAEIIGKPFAEFILPKDTPYLRTVQVPLRDSVSEAEGLGDI
jgi:hypothetical protein